jgi:ATP-dependent DNA helicase PIF1
MPQPDLDLIDEFENQLIHDELNYDKHSLAIELNDLLSKMTEEQLNTFDTIQTSVEKNISGLFFVYGFGGIEKTFLWRTICAKIRFEGGIVLAVASSEIASLLILGGRTIYSRFAIPINVNEESTCNIKQGSQLGELIAKTKLIICEEASMCHKHTFEAVDRTFSDIMRFHDPDSKSKIFGGKVVVLGGDFRQILPVVQKGSR